jgi:protein-S-isoprenylcysteine O-methyltransferase Ste14
MFFLAGLGALRLLWLPVWSWALALGDIAYLPYVAVVWPAWQLGIDVRGWVTVAAIACGLALFVIATATWLRARWAGEVELLTRGVYRWSRHPQYLGWLLWSYGMTLLAAREPVPMAGENPGSMLAWVVSALVVVGVALREERSLLARHGDAERAYRQRTAFLVPLPAPWRAALPAPWDATTVGAPEPEAGGWRLLGRLALVLAAVVLLSLPLTVADWPPGPAPWATWPGG